MHCGRNVCLTSVSISHYKPCFFFLLLFHYLRWSNNICHCCYSVSSDFLASTLNYPGLSVGAEMAQCSPTKRPLKASGRPPMGAHTAEHTKSLQWIWRNVSLWKMATAGNKCDVITYDSLRILNFHCQYFFFFHILSFLLTDSSCCYSSLCPNSSTTKPVWYIPMNTHTHTKIVPQRDTVTMVTWKLCNASTSNCFGRDERKDARGFLQSLSGIFKNFTSSDFL